MHAGGVWREVLANSCQQGVASHTFIVQYPNLRISHRFSDSSQSLFPLSRPCRAPWMRHASPGTRAKRKCWLLLFFLECICIWPSPDLFCGRVTGPAISFLHLRLHREHSSPREWETHQGQSINVSSPFTCQSFLTWRTKQCRNMLTPLTLPQVPGLAQLSEWLTAWHSGFRDDSLYDAQRRAVYWLSLPFQVSHISNTPATISPPYKHQLIKHKTTVVAPLFICDGRG